MNAFPRTSVPFLCLIVVGTAVSPCAGKPTREQILAIANRCKNEKKRMDLVSEFGVDFAGLDLAGVDFRGYYAVDYETNLALADFSRCNLHRAEFGTAILDGANFSGANLEGASFVNASLKRATLLKVNLKGTKLYQTDLSGAKLAGADLSSADITGSTFAGADLSDAILSGAKTEDLWNDFSNASLARAKLAGMKLNGACFRNAVLRSADLSGSQLIEADFTGADLTGASFKDANVESAAFRNAQGLDDAERARLEGQAQRWKFEMKTRIGAFLEVMYFPAYALVILTLAWLSFRLLRLPDRPRSEAVAAVINLVTFVPAFFLFGMGVLGASPTVQFNARSSVAIELWSIWVGLWPLFMPVLLSCLAAAVGAALVFYAWHWRWSVIKRVKLPMGYHVLTVVHCLFATNWVGANFPSA
jgi:uncharacterized protein YjbI with pentapeptide repeats